MLNLVSALSLIDLFFESMDISSQDINDGPLSIFSMWRVILAISVFEQLLTLALIPAHGIIGQANTVKLEALIILTLAPSANGTRVFLPLLIKELLLSLRGSHYHLGLLLDFLLFFLLLLFLFKDRPTSWLAMEQFRLIIFLSFHFLSCGGVRLGNLVLKLQARITNVVLGCVWVIVDLPVINIEMGGCENIELLRLRLFMEPDLIGWNSLILLS